MKKTLFLPIALACACIAGGSSAFAQSASASVTVTAANNGIFQFTLASAAFDFGTVDAQGTLSSTGVTGARNGSDTGSVYSANAATTWTARSAPPRTVRVYNASSASTIGWGTADRLRVRVPTTGLPAGSTSCGLINFSTSGDGGAGSCTNGALVHTVATGNGSNARTGNLDLELSVLDADSPGSNSWTVVLTATGS